MIARNRLEANLEAAYAISCFISGCCGVAGYAVLSEFVSSNPYLCLVGAGVSTALSGIFAYRGMSADLRETAARQGHYANQHHHFEEHQPRIFVNEVLHNHAVRQRNIEDAHRSAPAA